MTMRLPHQPIQSRNIRRKAAMPSRVNRKRTFCRWNAVKAQSAWAEEPKDLCATHVAERPRCW